MTTGPLRTPVFKVTCIDLYVAKFEIWGPEGSGPRVCRECQTGQASRVNEVSP